MVGLKLEAEKALKLLKKIRENIYLNEYGVVISSAYPEFTNDVTAQIEALETELSAKTRSQKMSAAGFTRRAPLPRD